MDSSDRDPRYRRFSRALLQLPVVRELRARGLLLPAAVGLAVLVTLAQGAWSREPHVEARPAAELDAEPYTAPPEVLRNLRPGLEKTPLSYHSDYWRQLGEITRPKLVQIDGFPGIVLVRGMVLTSIRAADPILAERRHELALLGEGDGEQGNAAPAPSEESAVAAAGPEERAPIRHELIGVDVEIGAALYRVDEARASIPFPSADPERRGAGVLVAAVSLTRDGTTRVSPGHLISASSRPRPSGDLDAILPIPQDATAAAVVDLDGGLLGVALAGEGLPRLWSYDRIARVVARLTTDPVCQSVDVTDVEAPLLERLGVDSGVLVAQVRESAYSPRPSLRPGDVLLTWNGAALRGAEQFKARYRETPPGSRVRYRVMRSGRQVTGVTIMPAPDCRPVGAPATSLARLGVRLSWEESAPAPGWRIEAISPDSPAHVAGLQPGDRILAIDGRPFAARSLKPFDGIESRDDDALLTIQTGDRARLVLVQPGG
jgi:S1-C subfamily serine protease